MHELKRMLQIVPPGREQAFRHILVRDPELLRDSLSRVPQKGPANGFPLRHGPSLEQVIRKAEDRVGGPIPLPSPRKQLRPPLRAPHLIKLVQPLSRSYKGGAVFLVGAGAPADGDLADA